MSKADFGDGSICIAQLVKDTFFALFHHPFIGRFVEDGFENAAEVGGGLKAEPRADFLNTQITVVKQHQHGKVNRFFVFVVNRSHAE